MKQTLCLTLLVSFFMGGYAQKMVENRQLHYGEFAMLMRPGLDRYPWNMAFRLGGGKQLIPGLDMGGGLETNLFFWVHDYLTMLPYVQCRGSSHADKKYGFYYSLSGGLGPVFNRKTYTRSQPPIGSMGFAQLMAGARIHQYGLLSFGVRYYYEQNELNFSRRHGLNFSGQLGFMLEGKDRSSPPKFDSAINRLYFYAATGIWWHRRTDQRRIFWDGSFSFGAGRNILPYLGIGISVTMMNGLNKYFLSNNLSLTGIGIHATTQWKSFFLQIESGPIIKASEGFVATPLRASFEKTNDLAPYLKLSLGRRFGKKKRFFLFTSYITTPQLDGILTLKHFERGTYEEYQAKISISRFQLGTGIFLGGNK